MTEQINPGDGYRLLEAWECPDKRYGDEFQRPDGAWEATRRTGACTVTESLSSAWRAFRRPIDRDPWLGCKPIEGWMVVPPGEEREGDRGWVVHSENERQSWTHDRSISLANGSLPGWRWTGWPRLPRHLIIRRVESAVDGPASAEDALKPAVEANAIRRPHKAEALPCLGCVGAASEVRPVCDLCWSAHTRLERVLLGWEEDAPRDMQEATGEAEALIESAVRYAPGIGISASKSLTIEVDDPTGDDVAADMTERELRARNR